MTPDPDLAAAWQTAAEFVSALSGRSAQTVFPVIDSGGALAGVVTITRLSRIPAQRRADTRLRELAVPVPEEYFAAPADPAAPLLSHDPLSGEVVAVVAEGGRITGLVTVENIRQALRWRKLAGRPYQQAAGPSPRG